MRSFYADGLKDLCEDDAPKRKPARKKSPKTAPRNAEQESPPAVNDRRAHQRGLHFDPLSSRRSPPSSHAMDSHQRMSQDRRSEMSETRAAEHENHRAPGTALPSMEPGCDLIDEIVQAMNAMQTDNEQPELLQDFEGSLGNGHDIAEIFMKQLLAKDVLYEPLKEITQNYVDWMQSGEVATLSPEERIRHRNLCSSFEDVVHAYETEPENITKLMNLFHTAQSYGAPPEHVYERLIDNPESLNFQEEGGLPGCVTQ